MPPTDDQWPAFSRLAGPERSATGSWRFATHLTQMRIMVGLWTLAGLLDLGISVAGGGATLLTVVRAATTYGVGLALSIACNHAVLRDRRPIGDFSLFGMVLIAFPCGALLFLVDVLGRAVEHGPSPLVAWPTNILLRTRINWAFFTTLFAFQSTISWLAASARTVDLRERQLTEARLSALRLQLSPHFLFNTLNAILSLVSDDRKADAEAMIMRLSEFLERSLSDTPAVVCELAAELDLVQAYLGIEAIRFGDRLDVRYECDARLTDAEVPTFILQPLVENAIKYAVAPSKERVAVAIEATAREGELVLRVVDDGRSRIGSDGVPGTGLGLRNVAARLEALHGTAAGVRATRSDEGFTAEVRLPLSHVLT